MIVIGLTQQVDTDAELKALTGMLDQLMVWHNGLDCAFMYRAHLGTGDFKPDIDSGWWKKETIKGLTFIEYMHYRSEEVNTRTGELIAQGYSYSGLIFPLSSNGQINLTAIFSTRDFIPYPVTFNNIDDTKIYNIVDASDVFNIYMTALGTKKAHLDSGTALKIQIESSTTDAEIAAIIDNR
jgi:hypothetical protein